MFDGYIAIGGEALDDDQLELVNSSRVVAYIQNWNRKVRQGSEPNFECGIDWYVDGEVCAATSALFSDGEAYVLPELDPAPWYNPSVPESKRFFGVTGLQVSGDEDSTRTAEVRQAVTSGGFVGRDNILAREITVRALAVAADEVGLSIGLDWMRDTYNTRFELCDGDALWFLSACPDCTQSPGGNSGDVCWAQTLGDFNANAAGDGSAPGDCPPGTWWPSTYEEFVTGPPAPSEPILPNEWCSWITKMSEYGTGLPEFACDLLGCIQPFVRQFRRTRITSGPTVLSRTRMTDGGFVAEVEFVVVAADPDHYSPIQLFEPVELMFTPESNVTDEQPEQRRGLAAEGNPFASSAARPTVKSTAVATPTEWRRQAIEFWPQDTGQPGFRANITLEAIDASTDNIRVGIWDPSGTELLGGWFIKSLPVGTSILIDGGNRRVRTFWNGEAGNNLGGAVANYDGRPTVRFPQLRNGVRYIVTIEQDVAAPKPDFAVRLSGVSTS